MAYCTCIIHVYRLLGYRLRDSEVNQNLFNLFIGFEPDSEKSFGYIFPVNQEISRIFQISKLFSFFYHLFNFPAVIIIAINFFQFCGIPSTFNLFPWIVFHFKQRDIVPSKPLSNYEYLFRLFLLVIRLKLKFSVQQSFFHKWLLFERVDVQRLCICRFACGLNTNTLCLLTFFI